MTLAVLEATLTYYLDEALAFEEIPVWRFLSQKSDDVRRKAEKLVSELEKSKFRGKVEIVEDRVEVGGGALPLQTLPTYCVSVKLDSMSESELDKRLRGNYPPIVGRIKDGKFLIDMFTVFEEEISTVVRALEEL
jgi:L-seryl-tRNA(Ser) seleniumtransferase